MKGHRAKVGVVGFDRIRGLGVVPIYTATCIECGRPVRRMTGLQQGPKPMFWHAGSGRPRSGRPNTKVRVLWPKGAEVLAVAGDVLEAGQVLARVTVGDGWFDVLSPGAGQVTSMGDGYSVVRATY